MSRYPMITTVEDAIRTLTGNWRASAELRLDEELPEIQVEVAGRECSGGFTNYYPIAQEVVDALFEQGVWSLSWNTYLLQPKTASS